MNPDSLVQSTPGLLRLEDFAALRVSGADRQEFLQGQLSQEMELVTAERAAPAAWCNRQGRVLCFMAAIEWNDATYLVLPADMADTCASGLSRFVLRAKVEIERWPGNGPGSEGILPSGRAGAPSFQGLFGCAEIDGLSAQAWACKAAAAYCAVRLPGAGQRVLLLGEPPAETAEQSNTVWTPEEWRLADIEAEIPWVNSRTTGKFLAHSLNLDLSGAVSFTKGCYVGQEIIARMEYRGTPKRRMRRLRLSADSAPEPGERFEHPQHGAVTLIATTLAGNHFEALAEVRL